MRTIKADYIFPVSSPPIKNGVVTIDDKGRITELISSAGNYKDHAENYTGVICPGFVNAHCHLELSWMKGKISEGKGLDAFIREFVNSGAGDPEEVQRAIVAAEQEMLSNGIVAVGDISNNASSFAQKKKAKLRYHTFVEVFAFDPAQADAAFGKGKKLFEEVSQRGSIVPHAPYSVSEKLMKKISSFAEENGSVLSMHNQESEDENELFLHGTGGVLARLKGFGIDTSFWKPTGQRSLLSSIIHLTSDIRVLLVHNVVTNTEDIVQASAHNKYLAWCLCPNANLFIGGKLPDVSLFDKEDMQVCLGTDSLASNHGLSILDEMKVLAKHFPQIMFDRLLQWATINGARLLNFDRDLGSIEEGKTPGLNLIEGMDMENLRLTPESSVRKLV